MKLQVKLIETENWLKQDMLAGAKEKIETVKLMEAEIDCKNDDGLICMLFLCISFLF